MVRCKDPRETIMAKNLALFPFTILSDTAISGDGWYINKAINTLSGNDKITGTGRAYGVRNNALLSTSYGVDIITGTARGIGIENRGVITTGDGNDRIIGRSSNDRGIANNIGSLINTGTGDDVIIGHGGIGNFEQIITGAGNDTIIGIGGIFNYDWGNHTSIYTGPGNDTVDASRGGEFEGNGIGGFTGYGEIELGPGNDTIKGFGESEFYGGGGRDSILFGRGTYIIDDTTIVKFIGNYGYTMEVNDFERIGGVNGGLFIFRDGTLTVDNNGTATFAV